MRKRRAGARERSKERVPETINLSCLSLCSLSLSPLSLSLSLSSQAHTNLDDPAIIALAELGHDLKLLCTADARRKKEERKKEKRE